LNQTLSLSSPFVLESIHDQRFEPSNKIVVTEVNSIDVHSSSNQLRSPIQTTTVSSPPTVLVDSIILKDVCENIFNDLNKLVKSRSNLLHTQDYVSSWTSLRERVDDMMCELQKLCLYAHDKAIVEVREWFKEVAQNMEEININRNQKLYLSDTPIFMDASSIISSSVQSEDPDVKWLTKLLIKSDAPILEKLKKDTTLEIENKKMKKELFEQRLLSNDLQKKLIAQQEEAKEREEALLKRYSDLKSTMEKQADKTNSVMQEMMDMMKKQAQP